MPCAAVKDKNGRILVEDQEILTRWKEYFEELLNVENERESLESADKVEGPIEEITATEVRDALKDMKMRKAGGPSGITTEYWKYLGDARIVWLVEILNKIIKDGKIPEPWADSKLVTIFKEKGDPLQCGNYRGIKLLEHSLKILEKVLDKMMWFYVTHSPFSRD